MSIQTTHRRFASRLGVAALALGALVVPTVLTAASASAALGDSVYIGSRVGYGGTAMFQIWSETPPTGEPDYWAYCIEHDEPAKTQREGHVGDSNSYLGSNHYATNPAIRGKVNWVLTHGYPALSLADFGVVAGAPDISENDAIEAMQYAIWRYTDMDYDASWAWETPDSQAAYWYLVNGANASAGLTPPEVTVSVAAPASVQTAGALVGPFVVTTNQATVSVSASPSVTFTDAQGTPIDATAVVNGQELYLDLRSTTTAGSTAVTVTAVGASGTGKVISVPNVAGEIPTAGNHAQSFALVAPSTATTSATASIQWAAQAGTAPATGAPAKTLAATGLTPVTSLAALALLGIAAGAALTVVRRRAH